MLILAGKISKKIVKSNICSTIFFCRPKNIKVGRVDTSAKDFINQGKDDEGGIHIKFVVTDKNTAINLQMPGISLRFVAVALGNNRH